MTWRVRAKLVGGILVVVVLCAGLLLVLDARTARIDSRTAQLAADDFTVGTSYSGTVVRQFVQLGDTVGVDQPLFELASAGLQSDLAQRLIDPRVVPFRITGRGTMLLVASEPGQVDSLSFTQGAFVPANTAIGSIRRAGSLYVAAEFRLPPQDYARITPDALVDVELPSRTTIVARARQIRVQTVDGEAVTSIDAYSPELVDASADGLFAPGTPLTARLHLRNDGVVAEVSEFVLGP